MIPESGNRLSGSCSSFDLFRRASVYPRQDLLQVSKELLPPELGALVGLLLIRPEARLLHAQVGPRARRSESPSDDTLETIGRPRVRERLVWLDREDLTVHRAPVCAKIETVVHDRLEVVLHQPLLDQVWLRECAPDLFRRVRDLTFDNDGARFGQRFVHWSILSGTLRSTAKSASISATNQLSRPVNGEFSAAC